LDAKAISAADGNVSDLLGFKCCAGASWRWHRRCGYGSLPDIRIAFA
jgi:hypothetical protein